MVRILHVKCVDSELRKTQWLNKASPRIFLVENGFSSVGLVCEDALWFSKRKERTVAKEK